MNQSLAPRLAARATLRKDTATEGWVLLFPEGMMKLNESAAAILRLCDGQIPISGILEKLSKNFKTPVALLEKDVWEALDQFGSKGLLEWADPSSASLENNWPQEIAPLPSPSSGPHPFRPLGLLAELTYRCPLHCPYCSNPVWDQASPQGAELTTEKWKQVLGQAPDLGVLHALFSSC